MKRRDLFRGGFTLNFKKFPLPSSYSSCNLVASSLPYPPRTGGGLCIIVGCIHTHASRRGKLREETYTAHVAAFRIFPVTARPFRILAYPRPSYCPRMPPLFGYIPIYLNVAAMEGSVCISRLWSSEISSRLSQSNSRDTEW